MAPRIRHIKGGLEVVAQGKRNILGGGTAQMVTYRIGDGGEHRSFLDDVDAYHRFRRTYYRRPVQLPFPIAFGKRTDVWSIWLIDGELWEVLDDSLSDDDIVALARYEVVKRNREVERAKMVVDAMTTKRSTRNRIPDDVKILVWKRDGGQCVNCGSNRDIEFDHIIPVALGGSSSHRNLQLLCEPCNRSKGANLSV